MVQYIASSAVMLQLSEMHYIYPQPCHLNVRILSLNIYQLHSALIPTVQSSADDLHTALR